MAMRFNSNRKENAGEFKSVFKRGGKGISF
jgi:hypothetical protein